MVKREKKIKTATEAANWMSSTTLSRTMRGSAACSDLKVESSGGKPVLYRELVKLLPAVTCPGKVTLTQRTKENKNMAQHIKGI